jgi:hypothetical protein
MEKVKREMLKADCTEEFANALQEVYITKVEALELLHLQLGHLPYQRIERMLQLGVRTGNNLDKKLLQQLVRQKCDICIRAKTSDSAHTGSLPVPDEAWRRFSTDLSAKFNTMPIHGNYYQMAIIDVKTKYIWDYYLETKDQVFEKIQEWLEKKIKLLRGRDPSGFEAVLFSDMGEVAMQISCTRMYKICARSLTSSG